MFEDCMVFPSRDSSGFTRRISSVEERIISDTPPTRAQRTGGGLLVRDVARGKGKNQRYSHTHARWRAKFRVLIVLTGCALN